MVSHYHLHIFSGHYLCQMKQHPMHNSIKKDEIAGHVKVRLIYIYSRLSLSRNRRDPQKQFEISVLTYQICSIEDKTI